ncbi:unnamed protein product [Dovyalis caffra]|uniref:Uncharacterized protein n=1 Tax=Dovyalis caffra TaxID=77055 RepID=A0AAV1RLN3_9ROSI|nr:unnamed protein product [Dovyalis caffra]
MAKRWRGLRTAIQSPQSALSPPQAFHSQSSRFLAIQATPREAAGSRVSARDREQGKILNLVFALADDGTEMKVDVPVVLEGEENCPGLKKSKHALLHVEMDEKTGKILNLVFAWADDGTEMQVDVPVVLKGEENCPGLKKGYMAINLQAFQVRYASPFVVGMILRPRPRIRIRAYLLK